MQPDARADCIEQLPLPQASRLRCERSSAAPILHRRDAEVPVKSTREHLMTGEAARKRNRENGLVGGEQITGRTLEP